MTKNIVAFDYNGVKVIIDANTKLLSLRAPALATVETLLNNVDNTAYQVPTGKKANIIFIDSGSGMSSYTNDKIIYADDLNGTTNQVVLLSAPTLSGTVANIFISETVPAGKYINKNSATATDSITMHIIEQDA